MSPITHMSDQAGEYVAGLTRAKTLAALREHVQGFAAVFPDAVAMLPESEAEFTEWRRGLLSERRKRFAGEGWMNRYGDVLIPALMLHVGMVAQRFTVPWGCAYLRCVDRGLIRVRGGVSQWVAR